MPGEVGVEASLTGDERSVRLADTSDFRQGLWGPWWSYQHFALNQHFALKGFRIIPRHANEGDHGDQAPRNIRHDRGPRTVECSIDDEGARADQIRDLKSPRRAQPAHGDREVGDEDRDGTKPPYDFEHYVHGFPLMTISP